MMIQTTYDNIAKQLTYWRKNLHHHEVSRSMILSQGSESWDLADLEALDRIEQNMIQIKQMIVKLERL
jgi:hypothetical protein